MSIDKIIISIMCLFSTVIKADAQNLVPNPSFELVSTCNVNSWQEGMENSIEDWFTFDYLQSSPDIFNTCYPLSIMAPPNTNVGYSFPKSGNAMAGLSYYITPDRKEVISIKLLEPLKKDSAYCVSFWIKNSAYQSYYWSSNLSAFFSDDTISEVDLQNSGHITVTGNPDKNEWIEISGYYIANSDKNFLNLGYFGTPEYYHPLPYPDDYIYYFVDDVSVELCNKDSLLSVVFELPNVLTLDNNGVNEQYLMRLNNIYKLDVQVLNRWGNIVRSYDGINEIWDGTDNQGNPLSGGVYFVKAVGETTFGDVLSKTQFVTLVRP